MSRTRNIIQEIAEVRRRRRSGSVMEELTLRLNTIERAFKGCEPKNTELVKYFPVAVVACIEGYFRLAIKELIDAGEPYLSNVDRLPALPKLDFAVIKAIHGRAVTVGELIGHSISISRLDHIDSSLSVLLGTPFLTRVGSVANRWENEVHGKPLTPILSDPDTVFAHVNRAFELRHIICHELATAHEIEHREVAQCFECSVSFLRAADELISETLHPDAPLTQTKMNIAAGKSLEEARQSLSRTLTDLRARLTGDDLAALDASQTAWEHFCMAWADFSAMEVKGGSMWSAVRAHAEETVVRARIDSLLTYRRLRG